MSRSSRRKPKSRGVIGGRARRARPGRGRRVAILAAVLGPVLAALFVAELATEGYWRDAAPTPAREKPVADRSGGVTSSAEPATPHSGGPSVDPAAESSRPGKDGKGREGGDKGKDKDQTKDESAASSGPDPSSPPDEPAATAPAPGGGSDPTQRPTAPSKPHPTAPATTAPAPTPSPTRTCNRVLWWCT
ncbi:hypothetical protein ABZU86_21085 [Streptomyces sp. NPDC005271]|uniref:hypothetical protein n=1 Tax=unclassified Streptomyces TaxID=2593676 RepID=UPI0033ABECFB